ncbi:hypothetical protein D9M72_525440 [compost metagenome]
MLHDLRGDRLAGEQCAMAKNPVHDAGEFAGARGLEKGAAEFELLEFGRWLRLRRSRRRAHYEKAAFCAPGLRIVGEKPIAHATTPLGSHELRRNRGSKDRARSRQPRFHAKLGPPGEDSFAIRAVGTDFRRSPIRLWPGLSGEAYAPRAGNPESAECWLPPALPPRVCLPSASFRGDRLAAGFWPRAWN